MGKLPMGPQKRKKNPTVSPQGRKEKPKKHFPLSLSSTFRQFAAGEEHAAALRDRHPTDMYLGTRDACRKKQNKKNPAADQDDQKSVSQMLGEASS